MTINETITKRKKEKCSAFIPYITAGDPHLEATGKFLQCLTSAGADIIELGVPFSDPMADGPTIQLASDRALKAGTHLDGIFEITAQLKDKIAPVVLFSYFNPILHYGLDRFTKNASQSGIKGVLIVDLPPEEASDYLKLMKQTKLETIFLASPTTSAERIGTIEKASSGFVYYISRAGVTGTQKQLVDTLGKQVENLKKQVQMPIAVGFGISTPEQAQEVATVADGVVVGSALVEIIEIHPNVLEAEKALFEKASALATAIHKK